VQAGVDEGLGSPGCPGRSFKEEELFKDSPEK